ncbi:MAG: precorrin-6A reductase [Candidatus Brocadiales bacterium]|nr:precorrin-6A reductase [Candidatus Brocadiales bacterium]
MSGTKDGKEIVRLLHSKGINVITTVATSYGKQMFEEIGLGNICIQGRLDTDELIKFMEKHNIKTVIDATHPYAAQASINAITACQKRGIDYIRYERESTPIPDSQLIHRVANIDDAVEACKTLGKRILLTTGFTTVSKFISLTLPSPLRGEGKDEGGKKEIIVRILPIPEHISKCLEMGIPQSNIIPEEGPFSTASNIKTFRDYNIDVVVTKDSGKEGGTPEKIEAALKEKIYVVLITRLHIQFPVVYSSIEDLLKHLNI